MCKEKEQPLPIPDEACTIASSADSAEFCSLLISNIYGIV